MFNSLNNTAQLKKVLVVADLRHSSPRISGLSTYLPEFGWVATILTTPMSLLPYKPAENFPRAFSQNVRVIEAPYIGDVLRYWRKIFKFFGFKTTESMTEQIKGVAGINSRKSIVNYLLAAYLSVFGYPDEERGWIKSALRTARIELRKNAYHAILSSSPYPTNHIIASKLKMEFSIPWVADFRDPWSQNHAYPYGKFRRWLDARLEKKTLKTANAIIAASPEYARKEAQLLGQKVSVITNGFDPDLPPAPSQPPTTFSIVYTGTIYPGKQDPEKLLLSLRELIDESRIQEKHISVNFYGVRYVWLDKLINKYNLSGCVVQRGKISRRESFIKQRQSQLLLLLGWEDEEGAGVYPLKAFEYLAARRPILVTGGYEGEEIKNILSTLGVGYSGISIGDIKTRIVSLYNEYTNHGCVAYRGNENGINSFSYPSLAKKLAETLNQSSVK